MFHIKPIISTLLRHKVGTFLVISQIAITLAISINAINIIEHRTNKINRPTGIDEQNLFTFNMIYTNPNANIKQELQLDLQLLRAQPEIAQAIVINQVPLSGSGDSSTYAKNAEEHQKMQGKGATQFHSSHHLLDTLDLKLIAGRNFKPEEEHYLNNFKNEPKVVIVTQSFADKLYPEGALGKPIHYGTGEATIIGIVKQMAGPWVNSRLFYDSVISPQIPVRSFSRYLIRTKPEQQELIMGKIETLLLARNPNRVVARMRTLNEIKSQSYLGDVAMTQVLKVVVALLISITALGIIGIVTYNINKRFKQIGTRRALGASKGDILIYFLSEISLITAIGTFFGALIAGIINQYLSQNYNIPEIDFIYYPIGIAMMFICGIIATWLPAQKASLISPAVATQSR